MYHTAIGIDPGLVDTGIIILMFDTHNNTLAIQPYVLNQASVKQVYNLISSWDLDLSNVFIEAYRPRSNFNTDHRMTELQAELKAAIPTAKFINNTGVKKVITADLMSALAVWLFKQHTNHQDLRSAARIALYGMVKDDDLNKVLADYMADYLNGNPWDVIKA